MKSKKLLEILLHLVKELDLSRWRCKVMDNKVPQPVDSSASPY